MDAILMADIERQIIEALPRWLEEEPQLRLRFQAALQKEDVPLRFETFEEFIAWADEDISAEWINGEVFLMSPASTRHQFVANFLNHLIDLFVQRRDLGVVLVPPYKMKLERLGLEPDLIFVKSENKGRIRKTFLDGPADLVVEVISPESIGRDRGEKFTVYETAEIPEYWLIDPIRQQAEFYCLDPNGRYQPARIPEDGRYHSQVLPGLWLQVEWLWAEPLPNVWDVLRQLQII